MNFRSLAASLLAMIIIGPAPALSEVVIALAAPLAGQSHLGLDLKAGAQAAVTAINREGGLLGEPLRLELVDDDCDARQGALVATQMVKKGIRAVIGHACSGASVPASLVYQEDGVLMLSPSSSVPKLTERGLDLVFRLFGRDDRLADAMANHVARKYPDKQIAVIHDKRTYGKGLADGFKDGLNRRKLREAVYEALSGEGAAILPLVRRLKDRGVDVVFFGGYFDDMVQLVRVSAEQDYHPTFFTGEAASPAAFWQAAGPAAEGVVFASIAADPEFEGADAIGKALVEAGRPVTLYGLSAHGAVTVFAQAVRRAGSAEPKAVAAALHDGEFATPLGKVRFSRGGDAIGIRYQISRWSNGTPSPRAIIGP
jgi:branched-chain amino acid transport system substrate-binding protein